MSESERSAEVQIVKGDGWYRCDVTNGSVASSKSFYFKFFARRWEKKNPNVMRFR